MTDEPQLSFYAKSFFWTALSVLAILPVTTVKSTSTGMQVTWICMLLVFCFLGVVAHFGTKNDPELQYKGSYLYNRILTFALVLSILLAAEILAIIATYAMPEKPLLWQLAISISHFGETVFPLVAKYATRMEPPLPPDVLYKTQAIMTLFLVAGAVMAILIAPFIVLMPSKDVCFFKKLQIRMRGDRWLIRKPLICVPFAILFGFAIFLCWSEFDPEPAYLTHKKCFLKAACYTHDDLLLIATGYLRICGYCMWLVSLMLVIRASEAEAE